MKRLYGITACGNRGLGMLVLFAGVVLFAVVTLAGGVDVAACCCVRLRFFSSVSTRLCSVRTLTNAPMPSAAPATRRAKCTSAIRTNISSIKLCPYGFSRHYKGYCLVMR